MSSVEPKDRVTVSGKLFAANRASYSHAHLYIDVDNDRFELAVEEGESITGTFDDINIAERLGNVERRLFFANGAVFVTDQNDLVDQLFPKKNIVFALIHTLESHLGFVLVALAFTIVFLYSSVRWGVPWLSHTVTHALPESTNTLISMHTLDFLDRQIFDATTLSDEVQNELTERFSSIISRLNGEAVSSSYTLHFRSMTLNDEELPNAFALPSGDIIITDGLVNIAKSPFEIDAVLYHEIGHVVERHSLQMLIQNTLIATAVMLLVGDVGATADFGLGLGTLLISSSYSRHYESEADHYAMQQMAKASVDPVFLATILQSIEDAYNDESEIESVVEDDDSVAQGDNGSVENEVDRVQTSDATVFDYLSSHPGTAERIVKVKQFSDCFHKQTLSDCLVNSK